MRAVHDDDDDDDEYPPLDQIETRLLTSCRRDRSSDVIPALLVMIGIAIVVVVVVNAAAVVGRIHFHFPKQSKNRFLFGNEY